MILRKPLMLAMAAAGLLAGEGPREAQSNDVFAPRMQDFAGSFLEGVYSPRTQVDLSSHCVSAIVKLQRQGG